MTTAKILSLMHNLSTKSRQAYYLGDFKTSDYLDSKWTHWRNVIIDNKGGK